MKPFTSLLLFLFFMNAVVPCGAQIPSEEWFRTFDGAAGFHDEGQIARIDEAGNVVVTGIAQSGAAGTYLDVVTRKYDPDGGLLWSFIWDNELYQFDDRPEDMEIAPNGDVIITGYSKITSSSQDINSDMFVLAISPDGNFVWADGDIRGSGYTSQGGFYIGRNIGFDLETDQEGNVYAVGQFTGNGVTEYDQMGVVKYNATGELQWFHKFDHSTAFEYADFGRDLSIDEDGNVYVCGVTTLVNTWRDFAVWRIDTDGNFDWIATDAGSVNNTSEHLEQIVADAAGNSYTYGVNSFGQLALLKHNASGVKQWEHLFEDIYPSFTSSFTSADAHLTLDAAGNLIFAAPMDGKMGVAKFTPDGTRLWLELNGGSGVGTNEVYHVLTDQWNNIYVCGAFSNEGSSYYDIGAFKLDPDGELVWSYTYDGPNGMNDKAHSMVLADGGNALYLAGFSNGHSGSADLFLLKLNTSLTNAVEDNLAEQNVWNIYPNPSTGLGCIRSAKAGLSGMVELFDVYGRTVYTEYIRADMNRPHCFELDSEGNGVYWLKVSSEDQVFSSRWILQR